MSDIIHITAAYSNAVLVAILPLISDFASKLKLPIPQPITLSQVEWSRICPDKDCIGAGIILTNKYWFSFQCLSANHNQNCRVVGVRAPTNWFFEQEFTEESTAKYWGVDRMTTNEVVLMAREALSKLGYSPGLTHADEPPTSIEGPFDTKRGPHHAPYCRVEWNLPKEADFPNHIKVEINMENRTIVGMGLIFAPGNSPPTAPIEVDVVPELESDYRKRMMGGRKIFTDTNAPARFPHTP